MSPPKTKTGDKKADTDDNIITIENFATKVPSIPADDKDTDKDGKHLYALVDMGSNGIRFSISDLSGPESRLLPCIYRERVGISLYQALHESNDGSKPLEFSTETISKVADTVLRFRNICDDYNVKKENILVFATEAMRTAKNKGDMLHEIAFKSGLSVDLLAPSVESLFGAMGARSGFPHVNGLFMDLGGGSVQMTYMDSESGDDYSDRAAEAASSMPYGAAKLTEELKSKDTADAAEKDLNKKMKSTFEGLREKFPKLKEQTTHGNDGVTVYFCGGGFRGYGSMLMHTEKVRPYPIPAIGGYTVPGYRFAQWKKMQEANDDPGKIFGMSKRRREQFPAIVAVVRSLVQAVPYIKQVIFCSGGNREGVLFMKLDKSIREKSPLSVLPGGVEFTIPEGFVERLKAIVPVGAPQADAFSDDLIRYVGKNMYAHMGDADDINSAKYLHSPTSGPLAGLPGFTHETRALFALIMCARWNSDIGRVDRELFKNLQALVGPQLSFLCNFVGTTARFVTTVVPALPEEDGKGVKNDKTGDSTKYASDKNDSKKYDSKKDGDKKNDCKKNDTKKENKKDKKDAGKKLETDKYKKKKHIPVEFLCQFSHKLGKSGKKDGIFLEVEVDKSAAVGIQDDLDEKFFKKVGRGLGLDWKVKVQIDQVDDEDED